MRAGMSIRTQVVALLIVSQLAALVTAMVLLWQGPDGARLPLPVAIATNGLAPLITVIGTIEQLPTEQTGVVVDAALRHDLRLELRDVAEEPINEDLLLPARAGIRALRSAFPELSEDRLRVWASASIDRGLFGLVRYQAGYQLADGRWLVFTPGDDTVARSFPPILLFLMLMLLALPAAAVLIWAGGTLIAPVTQLARRAQDFGSNLDVQPIQPRGPREVRVLARALNDMYARIGELVEARSLTLAAISHDLRTPLTRLRLRAEALDDSDARTAILRDTQTMSSMIDAALSYISGRRGASPPVAFNLSALIRTVTDDLDPQGARSNIAMPDRVVIHGDPEEFARAISNLLGNALEYGKSADINVERQDGFVLIVIADDGPGIPVHDRKRLLKPFERGDRARGEVSSGGFGLGLAIANDVVRRHGGSLTLSANTPRGLRVTIEIPAFYVATN